MAPARTRMLLCCAAVFVAIVVTLLALRRSAPPANELRHVEERDRDWQEWQKLESDDVREWRVRERERRELERERERELGAS